MALSAYAPGAPWSSLGKGGKASCSEGQGGWLRQGDLLRRQVLGHAAWELLLGPGWDGAHMLGGSPWAGQGLWDLHFEEGAWGTGTWGVAVGCDGLGAGAGSYSEENGLKYGDGNIGMQDEHARAMGKHAAAAAQGPPVPAELLAPHVHGCWCHWSLGQVPARGLPLHLQAPWTASACPVKSHTSPGRVSICSPEPHVAAQGKGHSPTCPRGSVGAGWGAGVARGHWVGLYPHGRARARGEGHGGAAVIVQVHHGVGAGDEAVQGWPRLPLSKTLDVALLERRGTESEGGSAPGSVQLCSSPPKPALCDPTQPSTQALQGLDTAGCTALSLPWAHASHLPHCLFLLQLQHFWPPVYICLQRLKCSMAGTSQLSPS